jgi:hypothetical protein
MHAESPTTPPVTAHFTVKRWTINPHHTTHSLTILLLLAWLWLPVPLCGAPVASQVRPWEKYHAIMWVGDSAYKDRSKVPLFFQRLREMGIDTAMVHGQGDAGPLVENKFSYYVENMVNRGLCLKWNSKVSDWDKFVTAWAKEGRQESALVRDYCLDDPEWRSWGRGQMQQLARKHRDNQPIAFDIRDELSTTISANPFDYDYHPLALAGFRDWLKTQYADLAALNAGWETRFGSWVEVKPFTTDQIKNRMASGDAIPQGKPDWGEVARVTFDPAQARKSPTHWNLSPWADFRTYMDLSLARALDDFRQAARDVDPRTPVGIEGTQMPHAFGGYDLWRLSQVLDWVEPYDIGNAREIFGSFMPGKTLVTTVFEKESRPASRRLWHLLLEGDRGCIIWWSEDCIDWKSPDYPLTPKAKALAPVLKEMASPLARLFLRAERETDPVFIHYSQPSIQVDWLIESTVDGSTWLRRFSSFEADHNRMARTRNGWVKALQDLGFTPQFISSEQIEQGKLPASGSCVLVLANSRALSDKEAGRIRGVVRPPAIQFERRIVFREGTPGLFDEHGKLRTKSRLEDFGALSDSDVEAVGTAGPLSRSSAGGGQYALDRLKGKVDWSAWIAGQLGPVRPPVTVGPETRTRIHRYKLGAHRLLAFERNINYQMSEDLKQAGGNESLEKPVEVEAKLDARAHVYDLRTGKYLGQVDRFQFTLDPWQPSLFAVARDKIPGDPVAELGRN